MKFGTDIYINILINILNAPDSTSWAFSKKWNNSTCGVTI